MQDQAERSLRWLKRDTGYAFWVYNQRRARETGRALERHIKSAHGGVFDRRCPACKELKRYVVRH